MQVVLRRMTPFLLDTHHPVSFLWLVLLSLVPTKIQTSSPRRAPYRTRRHRKRKLPSAHFALITFVHVPPKVPSPNSVWHSSRPNSMPRKNHPSSLRDHVSPTQPTNQPGGPPPPAIPPAATTTSHHQQKSHPSPFRCCCCCLPCHHPSFVTNNNHSNHNQTPYYPS